VEYSTVSGNTAVVDGYGGDGGGIFVGDQSTAMVRNSTVSGNQAPDGGGIANEESELTVSSSTITRNTAQNGGGVYSGELSTVSQSNNTMIAGNTAPVAPDCGGPLTSQGYNLIQQSAGCTITGTTTGNKLGVDPKLGPLANNGGPTLTHALLAGSPAIDAGNPQAPGSGDTTCPPIDQRSVARPQDGNTDGQARCDIGAVERERAIIARDSFGRTVTNGWGSAAVGGPYTLTGAATNYSVANGIGIHHLPTAGSGTFALLPQAQALNADAKVRIATDKLAAGGGQFAYVVLRHVGNDTEYRAQLRFEVGGQVQARLIRTVNNRETTLGTITPVPNVTHQANRFVWVRAQVVGSSPATLRVKVWADGQAEPTAWLVTATDTTAALQAPGAVGLRAYTGPSTTNAPVLVTFDDFQVTSVQP